GAVADAAVAAVRQRLRRTNGVRRNCRRYVIWVMTLRIAFMLLPALVLAQAPATDIDQALRSRVQEYFQDVTDGKFRQAIALVSEQTKTEYFKAAKPLIVVFRIDDLKYASDGTVGLVTVTIQDRSTGKPTTLLTLWNIENGKWVLHYPPQ